VLRGSDVAVVVEDADRLGAERRTESAPDHERDCEAAAHQ
jgi:hypothetical protein